MNDEKTSQTDIITGGDYRRLKRRRIDIVRGTILALTTAVALILFMMWYRSWPQRIDCYKASVRLANALNEYYSKYHQLPPVLEVLDFKHGRYGVSHYTYRFIGFGKSRLQNGMIIAYCSHPHKSLFNIHVPWRHVLIFMNGKINVEWVPEKEFQRAIESQPVPSVPYSE